MVEDEEYRRCCWGEDEVWVEEEEDKDKEEVVCNKCRETRDILPADAATEADEEAEEGLSAERSGMRGSIVDLNRRVLRRTCLLLLTLPLAATPTTPLAAAAARVAPALTPPGRTVAPTPTPEKAIRCANASLNGHPSCGSGKVRTGSDAEWRELRGGCYGRSSDSGDVGVGAKMERGTRKQAEGRGVAVGSEKQKCSAHTLLGEGEE